MEGKRGLAGTARSLFCVSSFLHSCFFPLFVFSHFCFSSAARVGQILGAKVCRGQSRRAKVGLGKSRSGQSS